MNDICISQNTCESTNSYVALVPLIQNEIDGVGDGNQPPPESFIQDVCSRPLENSFLENTRTLLNFSPTKTPLDFDNVPIIGSEARRYLKSIRQGQSLLPHLVRELAMKKISLAEAIDEFCRDSPENPEIFQRKITEFVRQYQKRRELHGFDAQPDDEIFWSDRINSPLSSCAPVEVEGKRGSMMSESENENEHQNENNMNQEKSQISDQNQLPKKWKRKKKKKRKSETETESERTTESDSVTETESSSDTESNSNSEYEFQSNDDLSNEEASNLSEEELFFSTGKGDYPILDSEAEEDMKDFDMKSLFRKRYRTSLFKKHRKAGVFCRFTFIILYLQTN
jgi:hypothetical protein